MVEKTTSSATGGEPKGHSEKRTRPVIVVSEAYSTVT